MLQGDDGAPEVVQRDSDLIPANNNTSPQVVQHQEPSQFFHKQASNYSLPNDWPPEEKVSLHSDIPAAATADPTKPVRRRRRIWTAAAVALVVMLAVALGVGLGVGLSQDGRSSSNSPAASE